MSMWSGEFGQITRNTPAVAVMSSILKKQEGPISVKDLAMQIVDVWGRDFPVNPYEEEVLVYKLAVGVLRCKPVFDNVPGGQIFVESERSGEEPVPVNPRMNSITLNALADKIAEIELIFVDPFDD